MLFSIKTLFFSLTFNTCLFFILVIGIQNSSNKSQVNFFKTNTIKLPISFIIGSSFISGSVMGSLLSIDKK